jgi:hypothetical protein
MPISGYNVGRDVSLVLFTSAGVIGTAALKDFTSKQITTKIKQILIDGSMNPRNLPEGWEGSFTFARIDSSIDDYFANDEANYYNGGQPPSITITETITNVDGSISSYAYTQVAIDFADAGSWAGNKEVDVKIDFMAGRRVKRS